MSKGTDKIERNEVYILSGVRTAIGDFGGALRDVLPAELGRTVSTEAIARSGLTAADIQHVVFGQVVQSEPRDAYLARVIGVESGVPVEAPALTVNRLCGSGLQAIISAAQALQLGEARVALAGGAESMSNSPYVVKSARWGVKMGDASMIDAMLQILTDPFEHMHMGMTAENVAQRYEISRVTQDELAVEGHRRAATAIAEGRFSDQIVPVDVFTRHGLKRFEIDEHVRLDASVADLSGLPPAFKKDGGTVTAGNASGLNDGAAAVVLATGEAVADLGLRPLAKILGWGYAGVDPRYMGIGPVAAVPVALLRAGVTLDQIDVIESNEAFAAQACAVAKELGFDPAKTNPNGSGIALGHPVGATGAILTVKAVHELKRNGGRYGLITMCIGGGQGIAMVVEAAG